MKQFRVKLAFETYRVGQILEPTGVWRDHLIQRGYIEPVEEQEHSCNTDPQEIEPEPKRKRKRNEADVISDSL